MAKQVRTWRVGDREPPLSGQFRKPDGTPMAGLLSETVELLLDKPGWTAGTVTITDDAQGTFSYAWRAADTDTLGNFEATFRITYTGGKVQTIPGDEAKDSIMIVIAQ